MSFTQLCFLDQVASQAIQAPLIARRKHLPQSSMRNVGHTAGLGQLARGHPMLPLFKAHQLCTEQLYRLTRRDSTATKMLLWRVSVTANGSRTLDVKMEVKETILKLAQSHILKVKKWF